MTLHSAYFAHEPPNKIPAYTVLSQGHQGYFTYLAAFTTRWQLCNWHGISQHKTNMSSLRSSSQNLWVSSPFSEEKTRILASFVAIILVSSSSPLSWSSVDEDQLLRIGVMSNSLSSLILHASQCDSRVIWISIIVNFNGLAVLARFPQQSKYDFTKILDFIKERLEWTTNILYMFMLLFVVL